MLRARLPSAPAACSARLDDAPSAARTWLRRRGSSRARRRCCRVGSAELLLERALEHAERSGDRHWRDQVLSFLGISGLSGPAPADEALERCGSLLERARGARGTEALVTGYTAVLEAMRGRF